MEIAEATFSVCLKTCACDVKHPAWHSCIHLCPGADNKICFWGRCTSYLCLGVRPLFDCVRRKHRLSELLRINFLSRPVERCFLASQSFIMDCRRGTVLVGMGAYWQNASSAEHHVVQQLWGRPIEPVSLLEVCFTHLEPILRCNKLECYWRYMLPFFLRRL